MKCNSGVGLMSNTSSVFALILGIGGATCLFVFGGSLLGWILLAIFGIAGFVVMETEEKGEEEEQKKLKIEELAKRIEELEGKNNS
jgi:hypothetical protein